MRISESSRKSLVPNFLYTSKAFSKNGTHFIIPSVSEPSKKIEIYTPPFYTLCITGGILSYALTHLTVSSLIKIDPAKYKSISSSFGVSLKAQRAQGFFRGWVPTFLRYSARGACNFGLYELFKKSYSDSVEPNEDPSEYKTLIYLFSSASTEVLADLALVPKYSKSEITGQRITHWGRQMPYTMIKFASFEIIVELIYKHATPRPKSECSKPLQLGVSFTGGYIAGVIFAIVSNPVVNLVSFLKDTKGATTVDAVKKMGLSGLCTHGLPLRIVMIGTLTGAQWGIFDAFKVFAGLPTTGGIPA